LSSIRCIQLAPDFSWDPPPVHPTIFIGVIGCSHLRPGSGRYQDTPFSHPAKGSRRRDAGSNFGVARRRAVEFDIAPLNASCPGSSGTSPGHDEQLAQFRLENALSRLAARVPDCADGTRIRAIRRLHPGYQVLFIKHSA
jgi:hypothetical protein